MSCMADEANSVQLNAEIPDWLNELIGTAAVRLNRGRSGWKSLLVTAALVDFLRLDEQQQRERITACFEADKIRREFGR